MLISPLKIVFAPLSLFLSHVTRSLSIAEALKKRGHQVEFISGRKSAKLISEAGFKTYIVEEMPHDETVICGAPREYIKKLQLENHGEERPLLFGLEKLFKQDEELFRELQPDLIVYDHRPSIMTISGLLNIPIMMIGNLIGYIPKSRLDLLRKQGIDIEHEVDYYVEDQMEEEFRCIKLGLPEKDEPDGGYTIPWIVPGIPDFEYLEVIPRRPYSLMRFVGPLYWKGWGNMPKPDPEKYRDKTVILITLGSSFPFKKIITDIISAFGDDDYHIIINTGNQFAFENFDNTNYEIYPLLSLPDFLKISNVVVHHGGHGTVMEVLRAGLPSVIIPFNGDQIEISRQMDHFQCGKRIKKYPNDITKEEIVGAIREVLGNDVYKKNALEFQEKLIEYSDGDERAADFVEEYWEVIVRKRLLENMIKMKAASAGKS